MIPDDDFYMDSILMSLHEDLQSVYPEKFIGISTILCSAGKDFETIISFMVRIENREFKFNHFQDLIKFVEQEVADKPLFFSDIIGGEDEKDDNNN